MSTRPAALVEHVDRYNSPSVAGGSGIFLAASSSAASAAPFFRGYLTAPRRGADLALLLAHVVETRFYTPPGMLQRLILQRDPVITCGGGILRLEGFSACCGVYARLDLRSQAFDADRLEPGTSNVDFNSPMRAALSKLRDGERARLEVSASGFTLTSQSSGPAFERRVELPVRWIKGFVEVQAHQARMQRQFEISGTMAQRFLRDLPRQRTAGPVWVTPLSNSLRLSHAPLAGGVSAGGIERLRVLAAVARHATRVEVYGSGDGATAWRLETPDARLFLVLSPEPSRGFSGEGQVLGSLAEGSTVTARVRALLRWQRDLAPGALAEELQVSESDVAAALAELGTCGLVGYDLAEGAYFHRELPFDVSRIPRLHQRLAGARELARAGAVEMDAEGAWVRGRQTDFYVRRDADGRWRCSCPWASRYGQSRGPCKHVLAAQMTGRVEGEVDKAR
jgi:SWIM zinc finger